ncbi:XdhC family protein [Bacillus sp. Marseille-P3661]|uniref:XdhC family protein n=1 Tax=Bacillus sp. Marseille-P3661 TaxID=1936234 RepID=UPI000C82B734|nr:XdhC family protein [Bacillus sp. Marseille-P3661]
MDNVNLIEKAVLLRLRGDAAALASIIKKKGSVPRNVGSKMIIMRNGEIFGTIGGGCGEAEVIEKALQVIDKGIPDKHTVDLTKGLFYEDGGICGGVFEVFIEPLSQEG